MAEPTDEDLDPSAIVKETFRLSVESARDTVSELRRRIRRMVCPKCGWAGDLLYESECPMGCANAEEPWGVQLRIVFPSRHDEESPPDVPQSPSELERWLVPRLALLHSLLADLAARVEKAPF